MCIYRQSHLHSAVCRAGMRVRVLEETLLHSSPQFTPCRVPLCANSPNPNHKGQCFVPVIAAVFFQRASVWSMQKDPPLESALARNHRWTINNQLKNIILRRPDQAASIQFLQKKSKNLGLKGKLISWLRKYPCFFETYTHNFETWCKLTKRIHLLVEEEEAVKQQQEPVLVERLAKILMLSSNRRINVVKFNDLRRNFGLSDDYLVSIVPKYPELFCLVDRAGKRNSVEIELVSWNPSFAVSAIEKKAERIAQETGQQQVADFESRLPPGWKKAGERFLKFKEIPYVSPYADHSVLGLGFEELGKRTVAVVHELLSLSLWKRASIAKLCKFKREFRFPDNLPVLLLQHPAIFYVSNKNDVHTVVLREGYCGSELVEKDPLVIVKEKFGELMQEGLHEYAQRRRIEKLAKGKANMSLWKMNNQGKRKGAEIVEQSDDEEGAGGTYRREERKRFQKAFSGPGTR